MRESNIEINAKNIAQCFPLLPKNRTISIDSCLYDKSFDRIWGNKWK